MRNLLLFGLLFLLLSACNNSNKLFPKKYLGSYHGTQDAYEVSMGETAIEVPTAEYELVLDYGKLWMTTPKQKMEGSYEVKAETKMYYTFVVTLENGVVEEWQLWKKGKRLIRKPIAPQPELIFIAD
ncbi:MAG TPA: hypothetical protein VKY37_04500 [Brumimicrobium sp.]|nr:hypothetical protein [Brumimicrobium sp.]